MIYVVPTPVGNLEDITLRSLRLMSEATIVLTEDPRVSAKLWKLLNIEHKPRWVPLLKNHEYNPEVEKVIVEANDEDVILLVSDAGTPGLSDPGREVIELCQNHQKTYTVLPGATALIPAVVASGLVAKDFVFVGFLPLKKGRKKQLQLLATSKQPIVLYESVHRIKKLCVELVEYFPPTTKVCMCRELSKKHEEIVHTTVSELNNLILKEKGEFVVILSINYFF
jgi:16S rRNA (cytidine1402-2'-O)-methyltransferase